MTEATLVAMAVGLPLVILACLLTIGTALTIVGIFKFFEKPPRRPHAR
jgi:hypothetical protein